MKSKIIDISKPRETKQKGLFQVYIEFENNEKGVYSFNGDLNLKEGEEKDYVIVENKGYKNIKFPSSNHSAAGIQNIVEKLLYPVYDYKYVNFGLDPNKKIEILKELGKEHWEYIESTSSGMGLFKKRINN